MSDATERARRLAQEINERQALPNAEWGPTWPYVAELLLALAAELEAAKPGPCLNCGSREQTIVCADCGRINPAEETP